MVVPHHFVKNGTVSMATLNNTILNILTPMFAVGLFDNKPHGAVDANVTSTEHNDVARNLSAQSHVLLKNDGILPLNKADLKNIVVVGAQGDANVIVHGGGSGRVDAPYYISPLQGIRNALGFPGPAPSKRVNCNDVKYLNDKISTGQRISTRTRPLALRVSGLSSLLFLSRSWQFHCLDPFLSLPTLISLSLILHPPPYPSMIASSPNPVSDCCKQCASYQGCHDFTFNSGTCYLKSDQSGKASRPGRVSGM